MRRTHLDKLLAFVHWRLGILGRPDGQRHMRDHLDHHDQAHQSKEQQEIVVRPRSAVQQIMGKPHKEEAKDAQREKTAPVALFTERHDRDL